MRVACITSLTYTNFVSWLFLGECLFHCQVRHLALATPSTRPAVRNTDSHLRTTRKFTRNRGGNKTTDNLCSMLMRCIIFCRMVCYATVCGTLPVVSPNTTAATTFIFDVILIKFNRLNPETVHLTDNLKLIII